MKKRGAVDFRSNLRAARSFWGEMSPLTKDSLREITMKFGLSVSGGDLQLLGGCWYITHSRLLRLAARRGCSGIETRLEKSYSDPTVGRWVFSARVYRSARSRGFVAPRRMRKAVPSKTRPLET
jgi:hypothetical protein